MSKGRLISLVLIVEAICIALFMVFYLRLGNTRDLEIEVAKALLQVTVIGMLGAVATFAMNEYSTKRATEEARIREVSETRALGQKARLQALSTLTAAYWAIKKSLHVIAANQSALSYGQQMREIIDHRLSLQHLHNEVAAGAFFLDKTGEIGSQLEVLDQQLSALITEWTKNNIRLSRLQAQDETQAKQDDSYERQVPLELKKLEALNAAQADKFKALHGPFEIAANLIREQTFAKATKPAPSQPVPAPAMK